MSVENRQPPERLKPMVVGPLPERPLVSVLISSCNYSLYLRDAIESCLNQSYKHFELIICDDGSTDGSIDIVKRYESLDRRIKAIYQPNAGQAAALNAAFRISVGDVICLLDADDVFLPSKLQSVCDAFVSAPESGIAVNKLLRVNERRKYLGEIPLLCSLPSGWKGPSLRSVYGPKMLGGLPPSSGLSLRRPVADVIFPLPIGSRAYADMAIQSLGPLLTSIVAIQVPLGEYRVHGSNASGVGKFTEDFLRNIVACEKKVWHAWREHIDSSSSDSQFPSGNVSSLMEYALARFTTDPRSKAACQRVPQEQINGLPKFQQWFWRLSPSMPDWFFRKSFNFVYGQTRTKIFIGRILKDYRNSRRLTNRMFERTRHPLSERGERKNPSLGKFSRKEAISPKTS